jgi:hypothetical protein
VAQLHSTSVVRSRGQRFKTWQREFFLKRSTFRKLSHESRSPTTINPELYLSSVLIKDQHVKVFLHVGSLLSSVIKLNTKH